MYYGLNPLDAFAKPPRIHPRRRREARRRRLSAISTPWEKPREFTEGVDTRLEGVDCLRFRRLGKNPENLPKALSNFRKSAHFFVVPVFRVITSSSTVVAIDNEASTPAGAP